MADVMDSLSNMLREELAMGVFEFQPSVDPVFKSAIASAQGVTREDIGKAILFRRRGWPRRQRRDRQHAGGCCTPVPHALIV